MRHYYDIEDEINQRFMDFVAQMERDYRCEIEYNIDGITFRKYAKK